MANLIKPVPFIKISTELISHQEIEIIIRKFGSGGFVFLVGIWMDMIQYKDWEVEYTETYCDDISVLWGGIANYEEIFLHCQKKGIIRFNKRGELTTLISPFLREVVMKDLLENRKKAKIQKAKERKMGKQQVRKRNFNESVPQIK